ncbi:MAG: HEPN domain-containing protein [Acetobacteraceae bacterium]
MTVEIMEKAMKALASARLLLAADDTDGATNRAYYAMFDAALAALSWAQGDTALRLAKTHSGLIASFGRHLVQAGHVPAELGRSLNRLHELRLTADYLAEPVPLDRARRAIEEAVSFVIGIRDLLTRTKPVGGAGSP